MQLTHGEGQAIALQARGRSTHREGQARSGSGDPELQARGRSTHREGQAKDGARLQTVPTDLGPLGPTCL